MQSRTHGIKKPPVHGQHKGFKTMARGASWLLTTESSRRQSTALPQPREEDPHIIGPSRLSWWHRVAFGSPRLLVMAAHPQPPLTTMAPCRLWPPPGCPWLPPGGLPAAPGCPWLPPSGPPAAPGRPLASLTAAPQPPPGCPWLPPGRPPGCPPRSPLMSAQAASDGSTLLPPTLGYNHLVEAPNPCPFITPPRRRTEEPPSTPSAPTPPQTPSPRIVKTPTLWNNPSRSSSTPPLPK